MNQAFSKIWIIVILIAFIAGGILAWRYFGVVEEEVKMLEEEVVPAEEEFKVLPEEEVVQKAIPFRILESDEKLTEHLIENIDLMEDADFTRPETLEGAEFTFFRTEEHIIFFAFNWRERWLSKGIIQKREIGGFLVHLEGKGEAFGGFAPLLSFSNVHIKELIYNQPEFIIYAIVPDTGTCVLYPSLHVLKIYEDRFKDVWNGLTFACRGGIDHPDGPWFSEIANVKFEDLDGDNNFEIIRTGYLIGCGYHCCCKEGPKKLGSEFQQIFTWDKQAKNFVEKIIYQQGN